MGHEAFRRKEACIKLQSKLLVAERQIDDGLPLVEHDEVIGMIRRKVNELKV